LSVVTYLRSSSRAFVDPCGPLAPLPALAGPALLLWHEVQAM